MAGRKNSKVQIELNYKGVGQLLKSENMQDALESVTAKIAQNAGSGYANDVKVMGTRAISSVYTTSKKAAKDNLKNNTLLKAVQR